MIDWELLNEKMEKSLLHGDLDLLADLYSSKQQVFGQMRGYIV